MSDAQELVDSLERRGRIDCEDARVLREALTYTTPQAAQVQPINRDSVVRGATLRAACYQLVELVEGRRCIRWQDANGFRLKDSNEWVAFYVAVKNVQNFTSVTHPADALGAVRELIEDLKASAANSKRNSTTDYEDGWMGSESNCARRLESALAQAPTENAAAKHWHDLYRKECQLRQDDAARYGQQIVDLEAQAPAVRVADEMANLRSAIMRLDGQSRRDTLVAYRKLEAALGQGRGS